MSNKEIKIKKKRKLPNWAKAIAIKFWFAGTVYFFVGWGLFLNTLDQLDLILVLGVVLGILTDLMVNKILLDMERGNREYHSYIMFPKRSFFSFILNIIYGLVLCAIVAYTYHGINVAAIRFYHLSENTIVLGTEPILFGIFCMAYDMLLLQIKKLFANKKGTKENENK